MKKLNGLFLVALTFAPVCAAAQRRSSQASPIYTHVPCSTPGAKEERPIDLRGQPNVAAANLDQKPTQVQKDTGNSAGRVKCVVEGQSRR